MRQFVETDGKDGIRNHLHLNPLPAGGLPAPCTDFIPNRFSVLAWSRRLTASWSARQTKPILLQ
jgi:hypothetical protein